MDADGPVTQYARARALYREVWRPALTLLVDALVKIRGGCDKFFGMER